ncbi:MAG: peptidoglycan-binding protein [Sulfuricella sp.]|nr:peptidoglycan-binding protein [Sulfuricella sp.]
MSTYRLGSNGEEVERTQTRLSELGLYRGPLDGAFGGATAAAAKAFQQSEGLQADGVNPRWAEDVRARKLCVAKGQGMVRGVHYSLEEQVRHWALVRRDHAIHYQSCNQRN